MNLFSRPIKTIIHIKCYILFEKLRLFWFIYIILVTPLKEFIQIYYVKNPVLNSANYDRCMPTRPPLDPRMVNLNKLRHTVLIWSMLNYKMARLYMVNRFTYRIMHPLNRFFSKQNTLSSFIWLYDFFSLWNL